jgi:hypothetical protein
MAAASTIVLYDGQATPVAHNFVPARKNGNVVVWEERSTAHTPLGFYSLSMSQSPALSTSPVQRSKSNIVVPLEYLDDTTGRYSYDKVMRANVEVILPTTAVTSERQNLSAYLFNLCAHAVFRAMLEESDPSY